MMATTCWVRFRGMLRGATAQCADVLQRRSGAAIPQSKRIGTDVGQKSEGWPAPICAGAALTLLWAISKM